MSPGATGRSLALIEGAGMKIVVIGASGRIGRRLVKTLAIQGCDVVGASPSSGVDALTGAGLRQALVDSDVVVDCSNSPSIQSAANFFARTTHNLLAAEERAGVRHHVLLSIVGLERLLAGVYFRAKKIQEEFAKASDIPFTIVRSTQVFDFISGVVQNGGANAIPIAPALVQPIAAEDVAQFLAGTALGEPVKATVEIAGPERFRLDALADEMATLYEDGRRIVADAHAPYFGVELEERFLLPTADAWLGPTRFDDWLRSTLQPAIAAYKRLPVKLPPAASQVPLRVPQ
jgi:uncharacterized protein YbjT (DUF2867 family)